MAGRRRSRNAHRQNTPMGILGGPVQSGGNCVGWWDWRDAVGGATITTVPNRAGNGDLTVPAGTTAPARTTLLGRPASSSTSDPGFVTNGRLRALLVTSVAAVSRPFGWVASRLHATVGTIQYTLTGVDTAEVTNICAPQRNAPGNFTMIANSTFAADVIVAAAQDLLPHFFGVGSTASSTGRAEMDGVLINGANGNPTNTPMNRVLVHINAGGGAGSSSEVTAGLYASTEPTADQRRAVRDYYRRTIKGLTIA